MRLGEHAVYNGKIYTSGKMKNGKLVLRSTDIEDTKQGFEPCAPFICRYKGYEEMVCCIKYVDKEEVAEFYNLEAKAIYKGFVFHVLDQKEDEISIVNLSGDYRDWLNLGMKCIDKGVYQKWIKREEAEIRVERKDL